MPKKIYPGETKDERKARKIREREIKHRKIVSKNPVPTDVGRGVTAIRNDKEHTRKIAFVLGNGRSRLAIDPNDLKDRGTVYGCNALYREFTPDYLVAVDTKMIREIHAAGAYTTNNVWTNANKYTRELQGINLFNPNLGWSSGPTALNFASHNGAETIYILGFDYVGIGKQNELVNNVYAGTDNYKKVNDRATYYGNWQRQTSMVIKRNPRRRYIRVVETEDYFVPDSLVGLENLQHITVDKFKKILKIS